VARPSAHPLVVQDGIKVCS